MPNIPIRDYNRPPQNNQRPVQYNTSQMRSVQGHTQGQAQQRQPQVQDARHGQVPGVRALNGRPSSEQLRPMPYSARRPVIPAYSTKKPQKSQPRKTRRRRQRSVLGDFFLSFIVALFVFGVAAIFVCNALISLFAS